ASCSRTPRPGPLEARIVLGCSHLRSALSRHSLRSRVISWTILLALVGTASSTPAMQPGTVEASWESESQTFLTLVNSYRAEPGLGPLSGDGLLQGAANWMTNDMLASGCADSPKGCTHDDSTGRTFDQRLRDFGYPAGQSAGAGENIAWGAGGSV